MKNVGLIQGYIRLTGLIGRNNENKNRFLEFKHFGMNLEGYALLQNWNRMDKIEKNGYR